MFGFNLKKSMLYVQISDFDYMLLQNEMTIEKCWLPSYLVAMVDICEICYIYRRLFKSKRHCFKNELKLIKKIMDDEDILIFFLSKWKILNKTKSVS